MASMPVERKVCLKKINMPPTWDTWPRRTASKSEAVAHKARGSGAHSKERASEREIRTCIRPCGWNIGGSVKALPTDRPLNTDKTPHARAYKQTEQVVIVLIKTKTWKKHTVVTVISLILPGSTVQNHDYTASLLSVKLMLTWLIQWVNPNTSCIKIEKCDRSYAVVVPFTSTSADGVDNLQENCKVPYVFATEFHLSVSP